MWWLKHNFERKRGSLMKRTAMMKTVRNFFDSRGFMAVETPVLQAMPTADTHIHGFRTELHDVALQPLKTLYLHTSPELAMKKLLVAGMEKIYQICPVFRNGEQTALHNPEFTLLEWYRTGADFKALMDDCVALFRAVAQAVDVRTLKYKDTACDPFAEWERLSVAEAFQRYAGMDLAEFLPRHCEPQLGEAIQENKPPRHKDTKESKKFLGAFVSWWLKRTGLLRRNNVPPRNNEDLNLLKFRKKIDSLGLRTAPDDAWDDLFFRVMAAKIEPHLGHGRPTILYDYPANMAALARRKPGDPRWAERFELYVCGVELANAFSELTDAGEQRARFTADMEDKQRIYGYTYAPDEDFLKALEHGMPECAGIALGLDRLIMLACGAEDIEEVLWTGWV
ncbi:MAG: EF-P lysine aminoacylase GenX [Alphaproteobacteria bacterium]|nr:EF-P lysine aminoacylase GenX [Alphaproteobacteria bacterium]